MYELSAHRYRELKHFCLQYPEWLERREELSAHGEPVEEIAVELAEIEYAIKLIETTAKKASKTYSLDILESVTMDTNYSKYKYQRMKFFWLLSREKGI